MFLLRMKIQNLRRISLVALLLWMVLFLAGTVWLVVRNGQRQTFNAFYQEARRGHLRGVQQLSANRSSEAATWLEGLAQDQNVLIEIRLAAIQAIGERPSIDTGPMALLLWIEQPFDVRHAAAIAFGKHGCDDVCISATLYSLHALWQGQPTAETQIPHKYKIQPKFDNLSELRDQSEKDYFSLLNKNSCGAHNLLKSDFAQPSDAAFVDWIDGKLGRC